MKTLDELREVARQAVFDSNGDRELAIANLMKLAENDHDFLIGFAKHGNLLMRAMIEAMGQVKH